MNIFILDYDPKLAASYLCDKHIVKMCLETAQILSTINGGPYKSTHQNHPCTLWAAKSRGNYNWLVKHGLGIAEEYTKRFKKEHKSEDVIHALAEPLIPFSEEEMTPFALAMPENCKNEDPVIAYRIYYTHKSESIDMKWTNSETPHWLEM